MGKPAARISDMHTCPMVTPGLPPIPHVGGPITGPGCPTVLIGGMPAAVMGDMCVCVGPPDTIILGSTGVMIGGKPAARMGDQCAHGGAIVVGCPTVMIGEVNPGQAPTLSSMTTVSNNVTKKDTVQQATFDGISIQGSDEFKQKVLRDLHDINKTVTGKKLLEDLKKMKASVTIEETNKGNSASPLGKGVSKVKYNPEKKTLGPLDWQTRPPAIGLAHELIHANQFAHNKPLDEIANNDSMPDPKDPRKIQTINKLEVEAVGVPPHDKLPFTENKIRKEWDPPQPERPSY